MGLLLAKLLPRRLSLAIVVFLCDGHCFFSRKDRQAVENNLKIIHGHGRVSYQEVRDVFRNFGFYLFEFFTMAQWVNLRYIQEHLNIHNLEYLTDVLARGKGGILISAHLGNWEMGGAVLSLLKFPLSVVALAHQDQRVNVLFNAQRGAFGVQVIQTDQAPWRVTEHLKKNRLIAIVADRDFGKQGLVMDFFGQKATVPKGAAVFSLKMGVPIIPVFFTRLTQDAFEINIYPPIEPPSLTNGRVPDDVLMGYVQQYLKVIETEIRKKPSQWLVFRELTS